MLRRSLIFFAFLLFLTPLLTRAAVFYPETFTLPNGLEIVVVPNHLAPAVTQMVWYKVGSVDEVPGKSGLAHYLEHLMFRGTTTMAPGAFSRKIAAQGGDDNAFTSYDYTSFHETVAADRLGMVMQMEADRMQNLVIKGETAVPELSVVLDERQQRTDNNPEGRFGEKLRHLLMPDYSYGIPVIGWKPEIEKLTAADAEDFYKHHYAPNNAIVAISGDVTLEEVKKLAADTYGKIPRHDVTAPKTFPPLTAPAQRRFEMVDAGVEQPQLEWNAVMPSYSTQKGHEAYALEVLSEALDGGEVGALYRDLVAAQGIASGIETNYDPDARGDAVFTIAAVPQPGKDPKALEKALQAELQKLAQTGLDAKSVENAKKRLTRAAIFERDSLQAPGYVFGEGLTTGHTVADIEAWPERIEAVTADQVNAALRALVASPYSITGLLLPDPNATPETRAAARKPAISRDQSIR
jgi:zinc protease